MLVFKSQKVFKGVKYTVQPTKDHDKIAQLANCWYENIFKSWTPITSALMAFVRNKCKLLPFVP